MLDKLKKSLFNPEGTRAVVRKNFFWLATSQIGSRFFKSAITIYAARALGSAGYGVFSYVFALAGFFIFFKNIGVDTILTREVAQKPEQEKKYFATAFWLKITLLIITTLIIVFVAPLFSAVPEATALLPFVAFILVFDDLREFFVAFFRGKEKMEYEAIATGAWNLGIALFGFLALYFFVSARSLIIAYLLASVASALIAAAFLRKCVGGLRRNFSLRLVRSILKAAWPLAIGGFVNMFFFNVDTVMLGWFRGEAEIGVYAAAQKLVGILSIINPLIARSVFPVFSRWAYQNERGRLRELSRNMLSLLYLMAFPFIAGGILLRAPLMSFVFGAEYARGATTFVILLLSILATFPLVIFTNYIFAYNKQTKFVHYGTVSTGLNVILNYLLIPGYGMAGAAIATLVSRATYTALLWRFAATFSGGFRILPNVVKPIAAAVAMGVVTFILSRLGAHLILNIIFSGALYLGLLYILKDKTIEKVKEFMRG